MEESAWFGDFIGGCVGTIFALVGAFLLFETLKLQRQESYRQLFDSTFFGLLALHREVVATMSRDCLSTATKSSLQGQMHSDQSLYKRKKEADAIYVGFYMTYRDQIAHYFRILYRIFCFIEDSRLAEAEKVKYAKMMRAQLSENELFLLYYNAFTPYGKQFQCLINEYNLLKHLPSLEKLEFQRYAAVLDGKEKHAVELVLVDLRNLIASAYGHIGEDRPEWSNKTYLKGKYTIKAYFPTKQKLSVSIIKKADVSYSSFFQQGMGLDKFSNSELVNLCRDFILSLLIDATFEAVNAHGDIYIKKDEKVEDTKTTITFHVTRKNGKDLRFKPQVATKRKWSMRRAN